MAQTLYTRAMTFPAFGCDYDDGYFDKDEQGWVTARVAVTSDPQTGAVRVCRSGDRNGLDPYEVVTQTRVVAVFPELGLVKLGSQQWYFDLAKGRLVDGNRGVVLVQRPAVPGWLEPARVEAAIALVFELLERTGGPRLTRPPFEGLPPRTEGPRDFARKVYPLTEGFRLELQYRPGEVPEFAAWLSGEEAGATVSVNEHGVLRIEVRGGLEHHPAARALAEAWPG